MIKQGKLELTWVGKYEDKKIEPRILVEDKEKSYGDPDAENKLIHGDNLIALKALEQEYTGKIKCIYIDPPYNTGSAFEYYDDNVQHSIWLTLMKERIVLLQSLLSDDGLIFVQIDDNEYAYLKVLMDEIFGRSNFVNSIVVKMSEASGIKMAHAEKRLPKLKEYILVYKKGEVLLNEVRVKKEQWDSEYKTVITNVTEDELHFIKDLMKNENRTKNEIDTCRSILDKANYMSLSEVYKNNAIKSKKAQIEFNYSNAYRIFQTVSMGGGTTKAINESRSVFCKNIFFPHQTARNKLYVIKGDYDLNMRKPRLQVLFADEYLTYNPCDLWVDIKTTGLDNEGAGVSFKNSKKPEALIERILTLATKPGDFVLDSFLGSGTTAAVAHKMGRKWIGIELGDHCYSHSLPRLKSVIDGEQSGISKNIKWAGGGGFKFYELGETLLVKNRKLPVFSINPSYSFEMMAEAICKIEGFKYKQNGKFQGKSSENRHIHITKEFVNSKYIYSLVTELDNSQSLLIYCTKSQSNIVLPENIEIKHIPKDLLEKCTFESEVR